MPKELKNKVLNEKQMWDDFIMEHMPLIHSTINKLDFIPDNLNKNDLISHGMMGLTEAMRDYDHEVAMRTAKNPDDNHFANFAKTRIMGRIRDHIKSHDAIPRSVRKESKEFNSKLMAEKSAQVAPTSPEPSSETASDNASSIQTSK